MNREEVIIKLKEANGVVYSEYMGIDNDKFVDEVGEAVNNAISSLEAWDNVIEEIHNLYPISQHDWGKFEQGLYKAESIINKHLGEVYNGNNQN